jgi:type I restriction enzyme S subunit
MPSYLEIALNMGPSREHIQNRVRTTAGQAGISQGDLYSCPVPVPPPAEQKQIVDEVERLLSVADDAAATAEREQTRAERLRQSILKQAFSGRLVPHEEGAAPPQVDGSASESADSDSSEGADEDVEDLLGSTDPDKQIEMDL